MPKARVVELEGLFVGGVRGMICGDHVDAAVDECLLQGEVVLPRAQRRIHLEVRADSCRP